MIKKLISEQLLNGSCVGYFQPQCYCINTVVVWKGTSNISWYLYHERLPPKPKHSHFVLKALFSSLLRACAQSRLHCSFCCFSFIEVYLSVLMFKRVHGAQSLGMQLHGPLCRGSSNKHMALQQGVSARSLDKWLAKLSPCHKVLGSAPLCFGTGTSAKWRCQTGLCRQRPLSPHIRVAVETSVLIVGLERFQHVLKATPTNFPKAAFVPQEKSRLGFLVSC